mgnify:CR=1 FL=1|jgi:hypothetical protein
MLEDEKIKQLELSAPKAVDAFARVYGDIEKVEPPMGVEPTTPSLRMMCSTN